jgi:iron complex transport system substrate-binding protein
MAAMLNGVNVVEKFGHNIGGNRLPFSMERLVMENPDIIFVTTMGDSAKFRVRMKKEIMSDPVWKSLRAVKNGNVHFLPNALFLYKANEHYDQAFLYLAKLLYPQEKWDF